MARIRTIKPEFFTSLTIARLSARARLLFVGTWTHVDDQGRCVDDARLIKAAVYPLDDRITPTTINALLLELELAGLIKRYEVQTRRYIQVTAWDEHQRINRPNPSKLPPPPNLDSPTTHGTLSEDSVSDHGGLTTGKERKGKERNSLSLEHTGERRNGANDDPIPIHSALDWGPPDNEERENP